MLLPALNSARDKAKEIKCKSNLKQMGLGSTMYMGDYEDYFVPMLSKSTSGSDDKWYAKSKLGGYVSNTVRGTWNRTYLRDEVLVCPNLNPMSITVNLSKRHADSANILCVDGHVTSSKDPMAENGAGRLSARPDGK